MDVIHNIKEHRFEYGTDDELAYCEYERAGNIWDLHHTFVPDSLRGRGVAAILAKTALEHVQQQGGSVRPSCSYIAAYIQKHPEFSALLDSRQ